LIDAILAGLFGLLIGSFLNVCIYRLPRDLSVVKPRSFCPGCEHTIAWYDNIPVLSFFLLRGKCRHCHAGISYRYPIVELITAAIFFSTFWTLGTTRVAFKVCAFSAIIVTLIFSDLEERILPDEFTIGGALLGVVFAVFVPLGGGLARIFLTFTRDERVFSVAESIFAALFASGTIWLVGALYQRIRHKEGLGLGDVKMIAMIGAFLGLQGALLTLILGSLLGSLIGLGYIFFTGKDASTYELPFGTFLGAAALAVAFFGEVAVGWWNRIGA
jgi:leader peptidase (prepilin peptidase)/N-methyltransferase